MRDLSVLFAGATCVVPDRGSDALFNFVKSQPEFNIDEIDRKARAVISYTNDGKSESLHLIILEHSSTEGTGFMYWGRIETVEAPDDDFHETSVCDTPEEALQELSDLYGSYFAFMAGE